MGSGRGEQLALQGRRHTAVGERRAVAVGGLAGGRPRLAGAQGVPQRPCKP